MDALLRILAFKFSRMEVFNIGNPRGTITILALAEKVIALARSSSKIEFRQKSEPDVEIRVPSVAKAERILGFTPKVGLELGISATIEFYRSLLGE